MKDTLIAQQKFVLLHEKVLARINLCCFHEKIANCTKCVLIAKNMMIARKQLLRLNEMIAMFIQYVHHIIHLGNISYTFQKMKNWKDVAWIMYFNLMS